MRSTQSRLHVPLHSRLAWFVIVMTCAELAHSSLSVAARIDGEAISLDSVDATMTAEVQHIHRRLLEVARAAVQDIVDRRLALDEEVVDSALSRRRGQLHREHNVRLSVPDGKALEAKLPADLTVAFIGDERVPASALEQAAALRLYRLRGELYLQRRRNLEILIERRLLQLAAQERGVSLGELEQSMSQSEPVTDTELHAYIASQRAVGRVLEKPERARAYLAFKKAFERRSQLLQHIRARTRIQIELKSPVRPRLAMETAGGVPLDGGVGPLLVVYTNYQCEICRAAHRELDRLLGADQSTRIVLHDFVNEPRAMEAAAAVRCAGRTNRAGIVRKHLLARKPPVSESWFNATELKSVARLARTSVSMLQACMSSHEIRASIRRDTKSARRLGFDEPPAFIAAGVPLSGMQGAEQLAAALRGDYGDELWAPRSATTHRVAD